MSNKNTHTMKTQNAENQTTNKKTMIGNLKKHDVVEYYGGLFQVLENARTVATDSPYTADGKVWVARCNFIGYPDGTKTKNDWLLEKFDAFQGNSKVHHIVIKS